MGDIVEIRAGDKITADGWLIEASSLLVDEKYTSEFVEVRKDVMRSCVELLKPLIEEGKEFVSSCSPVLLSGSLVKSGEGRMVVLAVGKLSRRGEFAALSRHHREPTHMQLKLEDLISTVMNWFLALTAIYILLLIARLLYQCLSSGDWSNLTMNWEGNGIRFGLWGVLAGGPQGLPIGVLVGLWVLKVQIWVK